MKGRYIPEKDLMPIHQQQPANWGHFLGYNSLRWQRNIQHLNVKSALIHQWKCSNTHKRHWDSQHHRMMYCIYKPIPRLQPNKSQGCLNHILQHTWRSVFNLPALLSNPARKCKISMSRDMAAWIPGLCTLTATTSPPWRSLAW